MKKKIVIGIVVFVMLVLFVPIRLQMKDGGSIQYRAVLYSVTKYHQITVKENLEDEGIIESGYLVGWGVKILGLDIFNNVKYVSDADSISKETNTNDEWGITLTAENVTPTSARIKCTQSGGESTGELQTGSRYILETWTQEYGWTESPCYAEVYWTEEAWLIPKDRVTEWEVKWERLYGQLSEGKYRIGKEITDFRDTGDYDKAIYYAEFEIAE